MIDPKCIIRRHTPRGTAYEIWKWDCPICNAEQSSCYIDGVLVHGDHHFSFQPAGSTTLIVGCIDCQEPVLSKYNPPLFFPPKPVSRRSRR